MAAYAALVSLVNTMENIQNHPRLSSCLDKKQVEFLGEKLDFLLDFVESYNSHGGSKEVEDLESQIACAAQAAEDVIEFHIVDQIHAGSTEESCSFFLDLKKIIEDMESVNEKLMLVKEERRFEDQQPKYPMPAASSRPLTTGKTTMVGSDGYLTQTLDELTGQQSDRQIIPIIGMGGIGKTTLARNVYENPLVVQHFHVRAWATVSQDYSVREILTKALSCMTKESTSELNEKTEDQVGEKSYKILSGRRYLIILDDIWSIEAWNKIKNFFPNNYNRSRIIVTTRLSNMANHFGSLGLVVDFLNDDESWRLFCEKAFGEEDCPPELEKIGKKIVKKCKGLPLSIVVMGGLLGKSSRTQEHWENVAKDISSVLNSGEENQCLNMLSLSYIHLPPRLKPCFLYLGIFSEDHVIRVARLIKLWVAEGFLKPNKDQSLEEIAEDYIKKLNDRNLILVYSLGSNGKFKTCYIHDLLRDLCVKLAEKEKFLHATTLPATPRDTYRQRCIIIRGSIAEEYHPRAFHTLKSIISMAHSPIRSGGGVLSLKKNLLRVLVKVYGDSLSHTFQQVNLRCLTYESRHAPIGRIRTYELPSSISLLWNVQTIIVNRHIIHKVVAPPEIWVMSQLRHLEFNLICLPDPSRSDGQHEFILQNLQTLRRVLNFRSSEEVCKRMPNIRNLGIFCDDFSGEGETRLCDCLNFGRLRKLESLNCFFDEVPNRDDLLQNLTFPSSLKKLRLKNCMLHWKDLTLIGSLPHLEVLKLEINSVTGAEWNSVEGKFLCLKFLGIYSCSDLVNWNADSSHFPVLEQLVLERLWKLDEIPLSIGEIPTLECICVDNCSISAAISAIKILEEQESLVNQGLLVRVKIWDDREQEEFREQVELEGFATHNFQLNSATRFMEGETYLDL